MSKTNCIPHPSGRSHFGEIPEMATRGVVIPAGLIYLLRGTHLGPNKGFGAQHIWIEHELEMARLGFGRFEDVPQFVARIIQVGSPVFFEGGFNRTTKIAVVRARSGTAILQSVHRREGHIWSIVTAFAGTKTHGTKVGTVR
ncbi:MAG: hypothetical protein JNM13_17600 [Hyphomicrobiaceae bacterium]|nr:hypothetical protein [Hyphomicrobiaceae bacterium]